MSAGGSSYFPVSFASLIIRTASFIYQGRNFRLFTRAAITTSCVITLHMRNVDIMRGAAGQLNE